MEENKIVHSNWRMAASIKGAPPLESIWVLDLETMVGVLCSKQDWPSTKKQETRQKT